MSAIAEFKSSLILPGREVLDTELEKQKIFDRVGDISDEVIMGNRIWVAKFIREKDGSLITADSTKKEDEYQGKVGLVIKVGPLAYQEDATNDWGGQKVAVGDWVVYRSSAGFDFDLRPIGKFDRVKCKCLFEGQIDFIVSRPDFAY